jgi:6-phosphogluconolactonase (cycloisomerase 2 family)
VDGLSLDGARALAAAPGGEHVYVTVLDRSPATSRAIVAFSRDAVTGVLTLVERETEGLSTSSTAVERDSLVMSPDGAYVYALADVSGVRTYARDLATGDLEYLAVAPAPAATFGVLDSAMAPDGAQLYVSGRVFGSIASRGAVGVYDRDPASGALSPVQALVNDLPASGLLSLGVEVERVLMSPDGSSVYALSDASAGSNISVFARTGDGTLSFIDAVASRAASGSGRATDLAFSPDGLFAYVAHDGLQGSVEVFARDPIDGRLTHLATWENGIEGAEGLDRMLAVQVSPDGGQVYTAGSNGALVTFGRDAVSGALTFREIQRDGQLGVDGLHGVLDAIVSPDGAHLYAAGTKDSAVPVFDRDLATGALTLKAVTRVVFTPIEGLSGAIRGVAAASSNHVHVASGQDETLLTFARDETDGGLTLIQTLRDDVGGVTALGGVAFVAMDPSESYLYAMTIEGISRFARDQATGLLTFIGVDAGLVEGGQFAFSPDGADVYHADSAESGTIAHLSRSEVDGSLILQEEYRDGEGGVQGLVRPGRPVVSPDGAHLYAAAFDGIAIFSRDVVTGSLTFTSHEVPKPLDRVEYLTSRDTRAARSAA